MQWVTIDKTFRSMLPNLDETLILCDTHGTTIGLFTPATAEGLECPLSEEELDRRAQETETLSTAEVLAHLETL